MIITMIYVMLRFTFVLIFMFHDLFRVPEAILIAIVTTVCIYSVTIVLGTCEKFSDVKEICSVR